MFEVSDDPVVDHHEAVVLPRCLRVRVALARFAVRSPARVRNTHMCVHDRAVVRLFYVWRGFLVLRARE